MNVFDVHVNRTPRRRDRGPARLPRRQVPQRLVRQGLDENERQSFKPDARAAARSGWSRSPVSVARRIVAFVEGAVLAAGQRVGLIRFGSRCDVYLPEGVEPLVLVGQRTLPARPCSPICSATNPSARDAPADDAAPPVGARFGSRPCRCSTWCPTCSPSWACAPACSIRYAVDGRWELAVSLIGAAVVLDGLDGAPRACST